MTEPQLFAANPDDVDVEQPLVVSYSYWPVNYLNGDPTVISAASVPLSGVQWSRQMRGVGELRATLQLSAEEVRSRNPWELFVPRKTGIVVVRTVLDDLGGEQHEAVFHGICWKAEPVPSTGRLSLMFQTVESAWARRKITGPPPIGTRDSAGNLLPGVSWTNADQAQIVRDLLDPTKFSQVGVAPGIWPGWINVDAPAANMGRPRTLTYRRNSETNLLTAHQDRSKVIDGYEWYTGLRVLSGNSPYNASTFRCTFEWGFPRLGRVFGEDDVARFEFRVDGRGNVVTYTPVHDGTNTFNVMWGTGAGYDESALKQNVIYSADWSHGFLMTEGSYSNPDVSVGSTLLAQTEAALIQTFANEQFLKALTVRGDLLPHFGTYNLGDDCVFTTDDWTLPDRPDGNRSVSYLSRIVGWVVTPPEGEQSEKVELLLGGNEIVE